MALDGETLDRLVGLAHRLADAAGAVIRPYFRGAVPVDVKADLTPVTAADREAEAAIRSLLAAERPTDGILGEEGGESQLTSDWVWVIDPIDGTKSFITGRPLFGTLIACLYQGRPILGVIDQPILQERWVGVDGRPTTFNGQPVHTRPCPSLAMASLTATSPDMFVGDEGDRFRALAREARVTVYGSDCYAYGLLACGWLDLVVEASLGPWDWAALIPVVTGAGGVATGWDGQPLTLGSPGRLVAAGDPALHAAVIRRLSD